MCPSTFSHTKSDYGDEDKSSTLNEKASIELRKYLGEDSDNFYNFTSLTETPIRDVKNNGNKATAVTQLALEPQQLVGLINDLGRDELHGVNLFPACSALVRDLTGEEISSFKNFSIRNTIRNELDLIVYEGKFKDHNFANGRKFVFKAEVYSGGKRLFIRGYSREDKIINIVYPAYEIQEASALDLDSLWYQDSVYSFESLPIIEGLIPKKLLQKNMPFVISSIAYHLGENLIGDTDFLHKYMRDKLPSKEEYNAFIYSFKNSVLPKANFFEGEVCFEGEINLKEVSKTESGNVVLPCNFRVVNSEFNIEYQISIDLAFID